MLFKRIKIENIRSYDNAEVIFPKGSTLLTGDIGAGKTSILLAIEFALFGLQPGQKGTALLKNDKDTGSVELEFEIDGNNIIVTRTLKRKKTVGQESCYININGKVEEKAVTELKNSILNLLNYPLEFAKKTNLLYRFTVYTPQEEMKQIILESPEIRLNTLRHVFGIDKYKRIKENASLLTAKLREMSRHKQGEISDLDLKKQRIEEKRNSYIESTSKLPSIEKELQIISVEKKQKESDIAEIKSKVDEMRKLNNEIEKANILIHTKNEHLSKTKLDILNLSKKISESSESFNQDKLDEFTKSLLEKKQIRDSLNKETIELSTKIIGLNSKINELDQVKQKISNLKVCPTCLQEVNENHKHGIFSETETEIGKIKNEKISLDTLKQQREISLNNIKVEVENLEKQKTSLEILKIKNQTIQEEIKNLEILEKTKSSLELDINLLEKQLLTIRESISELKKYEPIIQAREKELTEILLRERSSEIKKAETVKELEYIEKDISLLEKEINEKEKIKEDLIYLVELESWVSSEFIELMGVIERNVMIKLRDQFSKLFNEWFSILVPDTFLVHLDEEFTPVIEQQDYQLDYNYLSGGERTSVALAYRLALNQTINSFLSEIKTKGIVILDEPTDGFSQQQLDKMRDVLKQLTFDQLIMVSHDQKIEGFVDNIIRLKKDHGISKLN